MLKRFAQGAIRSAAIALGATPELHLSAAQLQTDADRAEDKSNAARMRAHVDRPDAWKGDFRTTQTGAKITYLGRREDR